MTLPLGELFGVQARHADGLFVEPRIYRYGLLDEYAVNAYWAGHPRHCLDAVLTALERGAVPAAERPRFVQNARFAFAALSAALP